MIKNKAAAAAAALVFGGVSRYVNFISKKKKILLCTDHTGADPVCMCIADPPVRGNHSVFFPELESDEREKEYGGA